MNKKYQDLINKKMDGLLSAEEKRQLDKILAEDPQAANYHQQMMQMLQQLNDVAELEPSANLKKYVMNSIDTEKYARAENRTNQWLNTLAALLPRPRLAAAFALGLLTGIFVLSVYINHMDNTTLAVTDIQGTIGMDQTARLDIASTLPVNTANVSGEIVVAHSTDHIVIESKIIHHEYCNLIVEFDAAVLRFMDFRPRYELNASLETGPGFVKIKGEDSHLLQLIFEKKSLAQQPFRIKLTTSSQTVLDKTISL